jgi:hypothetical protein
MVSAAWKDPDKSCFVSFFRAYHQVSNPKQSNDHDTFNKIAALLAD